MDKKKIKKIVRDTYGKIAQGQEGCGCGTCGPDAREFVRSIGYSENELKAIPDEANLALSCGNPTALANLTSACSRPRFARRLTRTVRRLAVAFLRESAEIRAIF